MKNSYKILIFAGNPTQYHAPIFRLLYQRLGGHSLVLFAEDLGAEPFYSKELDSVIKWDVPILDGYEYMYFKNYASRDSKGFFSRINPGLIWYVFRSDAQFVLVHGYDTLSSWFVFLTAMLSRKKILWRGEAIERKGAYKNFYKAFLKKIVLKFYFKWPYRIFYSCGANKRYLEQYIDEDRLKFLPCAVDNSFFELNKIKDKTELSRLKSSLGIPDDHTVFGTTCRLTSRKRVNLLLGALHELGLNNVTILIIGDGPERKSLQDLALIYDLNVVFVGFVGQFQVARYLSLLDVFVLLSEYDASPKALNEALSYSLPLIVSDGIGTAYDLVCHGVNGFIVSTGRESDLVKYLQLLAEDGNLRAKMGERTTELLTTFSIENDVKAIEDVLDGNS